MNRNAINLSLIAFTLIFLIAFIIGLALPAWSAESDYGGTYAGTYKGDENGYWVAIADSSSYNAFLSYAPGTGNGDVGYLIFDSELGTVGSYYCSHTDIQDSAIEADVDSSDGSVRGDWDNNVTHNAGTFSGHRITSCDYDGDYSGTFSGDDSGTWQLTIASDGTLSGTITTDGDTYAFEGGCHPDGYVLAIGETGGVVFGVFGEVSGSDISGIWASEDGASGTIRSGSGSGGGGSSGGGSSGCFISSLAGSKP